jgi:hypothetical protein
MSFAEDVCGESITSGACVLIQGRCLRGGKGGSGSGRGRWRGGDEPGEEGLLKLNWLSVELVTNSAKQQRTHHTPDV